MSKEINAIVINDVPKELQGLNLGFNGNKYYVLLDENGQRTSPTYLVTDKNIPDDVKQNGVVVDKMTQYALLNGYQLDVATGTLSLIPSYEPSLNEIKAQKTATLKAERDAKEVEPITYNGSRFDYDEKARDRINAAIIALDMAGAEATLEWTTADNTNVTVTANDLRAVIAAVAVRSNALHEAYRLAKEEIAAATTKAEVEEITLNVSVQNTENSDK